MSDFSRVYFTLYGLCANKSIAALKRTEALLDHRNRLAAAGFAGASLRRR
jgi:hypothetical protein